MPDEVRVVVKQESQGDAIAKAEADLKRLRELAATYDAKGIPEAAKSVRGEAKAVEQDLARLTKERGVEEKRITAERRQQEAVGKAVESRRMQLLRAGANFAEGQAGVGGFSGITTALSGSGGAAGLVGAISVAIGAAILAADARRAVTFRTGELESGAARSRDLRSLARQAGFEGTSGGLREEARSAREEAAERESQKAKLELASKPKWYSDFGLWVNNKLFGAGMKTTEGEAAERENSAAQSRAIKRAKEAEELQRTKFAEVGGQEIAAAEKIAQGDMAGARAIQAKLEYHREYLRLLKEGGTQDDAIRGADAKFSADIRQREQRLGGLIGARTGAAAAARIASLGGRQYGAVREAVAEQRGTELLHAVNNNHREAMNAASRKDFVRK